ncbi:MAG: alpha/beta fold hydrolase [Actinoplanes sp.]
MTLAYEETGSGPLVVLVHSTAADRGQWDPQVPALTGAGFRVLRCDLRGFGGSPMPDAPYNEAKDVLELTGDETFALVGSSGGGQVALEIAARWPHRVFALALLNTAKAGLSRSAGPELRAFWDSENALMEAGDLGAAADLNATTWLGPSAGPEAHAALRRMQLHAFEVQAAATDEPAAINSRYDLTAITAPTLLVSGRHDFIDFREIAVELTGLLPHASHVELDWAGHLPNMERPDEINRLLIDFLSKA